MEIRKKINEITKLQREIYALGIYDLNKKQKKALNTQTLKKQTNKQTNSKNKVVTEEEIHSQIAIQTINFIKNKQNQREQTRGMVRDKHTKIFRKRQKF